MVRAMAYPPLSWAGDGEGTPEVTEPPRSTQARLAHRANMLHTPNFARLRPRVSMSGRVKSGLLSYLLHALGEGGPDKDQSKRTMKISEALLTVLLCFSVTPSSCPQPSLQYTLRFLRPSPCLALNTSQPHPGPRCWDRTGSPGF